MPTPSLLTLTTSLLSYPLLLRLLTGSHPTPSRYTAALKTTSTIHSLLTTTLALIFLHHHRPQLPPSSPKTSGTQIHRAPGQDGYPNDTHNPTITSHSSFGNAITALEAGYLIQDTFALLLKSHIHSRAAGNHARPKTKLDIPLLTHHVSLSAALLLLQYYISQRREAGIYIIVQFLLMNASTPVLNLRWWLRTYRPGGKGVVLAADVGFAVVFFVARVGLVWSILRDYGAWHGWGAWEAYWVGLRVPCKVGTGALLGVNLGWWGVMVRNLGRRVRR